MKLLSRVSLLMCALVITAGAISSVAQTNAQDAGTAGSTTQDAMPTDNAAPTLSGNWQMSWEAMNGNQRQATMQIKQDGSKLSGSFQGERGSAQLKGTLHGNQVSLSVKLPRRQISFAGTVDGDKMSGTTEQGVSWTATRQ